MKLLSRIRTLARVRPLPEGDLPEVAETVAIIMDGNGRWARRRGLPTAVGHRAGTRALRRTVEARSTSGSGTSSSTRSRPRTGRGRRTRSTR